MAASLAASTAFMAAAASAEPWAMALEVADRTGLEVWGWATNNNGQMQETPAKVGSIVNSVQHGQPYGAPQSSHMSTIWGTYPQVGTPSRTIK